MMNQKPKNIAGQMGKRASQPAKMNKAASVDPIERLNQRMAGRTEGGNKPKKRKSLMNNYGMVA
jgi:hypothetical protein